MARLNHGRIFAAFAPKEVLTLAEWAETYRILPDTGARPGQFSLADTPYMRGVYEAYSDTKLETIVLMCGAQLGKTEFILNVIGYHLHYYPAPMVAVQPNETLAHDLSKKRLAPMLRCNPEIGRLVTSGEDTILDKNFPGGFLKIGSALSPNTFTSIAARNVLLDELDRFPKTLEGEGDPITLARKRMNTFTYGRKLIMVSTPTVKYDSMIEAEFEKSDQRYYHVPCPECGHKQKLSWKQVKWRDNDPNTATYECEYCATHWDDAMRWQAIHKGEWVATAKSDVAGFQLSSLYSCWTSLKQLVGEFLRDKDKPSSLQAFVNTNLAETWEPKGQKSTKPEALMARAEEYDAHTLPHQAGLLTAAVDVQPNRLEIQIIAWGLDEERWVMDHRILYGSPENKKVWAELTAVLQETYTQPVNGENFKIEFCCVDAGYLTHAVTSYCNAMQKAGMRCVAIKGIHGEGREIIGKITKGKFKNVVGLGVDTIKDLTTLDLSVVAPGARRVHFPKRLPLAYYEGLTSEHVVIEQDKKTLKPKRVWKKKSADRPNEQLDTFVYNYAAFTMLGVDMMYRMQMINNQPTDDDEEEEINLSDLKYL